MPVAGAVNVAAMMHEAPAANDEPQGEEEVISAKSEAFAPPSATLLIVIAVLPVFVRVVVDAAVAVPLVAVENARTVVEKEAIGAGAVATPVNVTVCGEFVALSVTVIVAAYVPTDGGVNVAEMVHDAPTANVLPQLLVVAKAE